MKQTVRGDFFRYVIVITAWCSFRFLVEFFFFKMTSRVGVGVFISENIFSRHQVALES